MENKLEKASSLGLPVELRLTIYKATLPQEGKPLRLHGDTMKLVGNTSWPCVSTLSQSYKQIRREVADILYTKNMFGISISNPNSESFPNVPTMPDLSLLSILHRVDMDVFLDLDKTIDIQVALLGKMLANLQESSKLDIFTFRLGMHEYMLDSRLKRQGLVISQELGSLRRMATREGVRAGRNAKEREIEYALKVVELMKNVSEMDDFPLT